MDLRTLPPNLPPEDRCNERRNRIEKELGMDLSMTEVNSKNIGQADEKNCEQMFGQIPLPVGYAGPLNVTFSSEEKATLHLPLATTEGALVASVNRGCKALTESGTVETSSVHHGTSRSLAFHVKGKKQTFIDELRHRENEWKVIAEGTSDHLKVLKFDIDEAETYVFLTLFCHCDEAMGMNMVTIAGNAVGQWIQEHITDPRNRFVTVAANIDSDKKPSLRTYDRGRGYEVFAKVTIPEKIIESVLKSSSQAMLDVAHAKLELGSSLVNALGSNLHAANIVAALYAATGQDLAHVVEGSMADTSVEQADDGLIVTVRLPAVMVGVRGGGTSLPAQNQCLSMLLKDKTSLHPCAQLAESIGAAVLAGEVSLLAAQASHTLAKAHKDLAR
jgi:hydroxymethylglutaryl-CoA reductase (NADPH)